eukprot:109201-Prymnesium_polylepis.1
MRCAFTWRTIAFAISSTTPGCCSHGRLHAWTPCSTRTRGGSEVEGDAGLSAQPLEPIHSDTRVQSCGTT